MKFLRQIMGIIGMVSSVIAYIILIIYFFIFKRPYLMFDVLATSYPSLIFLWYILDFIFLNIVCLSMFSFYNLLFTIDERVDVNYHNVILLNDKVKKIANSISNENKK